MYTPNVTKVSGASVGTSPFFGHGEACCSAVIYSVMDFFNIDRFHGNDFGVYHNPNAAHPLPIGTFPMFDQFVPEPVDESRFTLRPIPRTAA